MGIRFFFLSPDPNLVEGKKKILQKWPLSFVFSAHMRSNRITYLSYFIYINIVVFAAGCVGALRNGCHADRRKLQGHGSRHQGNKDI